MAYSNFHQHSLYCDGNDTLAAIAQQARLLRFSALGFSSHAPAPWPSEEAIDFSWLMPKASLPAYRQEIAELQRVYQDTMEIYAGLEADYFDTRLNPKSWQNQDFHFIIGAVHVLPSSQTACGFMPIDARPEALQTLASEYKNAENLCKAYFERQALMLQTGGLDVLAHMELINKYNSHEQLFSRSSASYSQALREVLALAVEKSVIIEINTGYMARKGLSEPFPCFATIKEAHSMGARFCLSSDCHNLRQIDWGFGQMRDFLLAAGIGGLWRLKAGTWQEEAL